MSTQEHTIVFMTFSTLGEASIVQGLLEANEIPCFVSNVNSIFTPGMFLDNSAVQLHIFEQDLERATQVLEKADLPDDEADWGIDEDIPEEFRDDGKEE